MSRDYELKSGESIYKFDLYHHVGEGGFGDVWLAHDKTIQKDIAVKILDPDTQLASRITINEQLYEARIGNKLEHPNLVKMHYADVVTHKGADLVLIAMDYHEKGSIVSRVNSCNFLPLQEALKYTIDILRGLEYLHEHNLYHNDIKPQNILVGPCDQGVLTDYGITSYSPNRQPVKYRNAYSPHIAPESIETQQISEQTEIYQVGLTAFRLLNNIASVSQTFDAIGKNEFFKLVSKGKVVQTKDYQPFIPRNLKTVINKAINVNPALRYKTALEMRRALEGLCYPGYWTTDDYGEYVGYNERYEFSFVESHQSSKSISFAAYKRHKISNRKTKISQFSKTKLSAKEAASLRRKFMQWVVTGD